MFNMKNKKLRAIFFLIIILVISGIVYYKNKIEWQYNPIKVIQKSFKFKNKHDYEAYKKCYKYPESIQEDSIDNIESVNIINIDKVNDANLYKSFIDSDNIDEEDIEIYKVKYDIKFNDESKSSIGNGEDEIDYILAKDQSSKWKIYSWGR